MKTNTLQDKLDQLQKLYDAECEKNANEAGRLRAELAVAENWVEHHSKHADDLIAENVKLRAEVEALKQSIESGQRVLREDAERNAARAERAEAMLAEWSVLNLWGGTPEIIHEFIKGQQNRIHHCQDLEAECLEQARLLGMSGEREADLLGKLERTQTTERLWKEFITLMEITEESDSGNAFNPNKISSCRAMDGKRLNEILIEARQIVF